MNRESTCSRCGCPLATPDGDAARVCCARCGAIPEAAASLPAGPSAEIAAVAGVSLAMPHRFTPWLVSATIHGAVILAMLLTTMLVVERHNDEVLVPEAVLADQPGGSLDTRDMVSTLIPSVVGIPSPSPVSQDRGGAAMAAAPDRELPMGKPVDLIGLGSASPASAGGAMSALGMDESGGGSAPRSEFFGAGGNAYNIVYVIDCSGSMVADFPYVKNELLASISRLKPRQSFHVILFSDGPPHELKTKAMVPATPENKLLAADFLSSAEPRTTPKAITDAAPSLLRAMALLDSVRHRGHGLIYLLSDGDIRNEESLLKAINERDDKGLRINTYMYGDPIPDFVTFMKKIAALTGGQFKFVNFTGEAKLPE